jgi:hypothetical protein
MVVVVINAGQIYIFCITVATTCALSVISLAELAEGVVDRLIGLEKSKIANRKS